MTSSQPTPEQVQGARDRYALQQAQAWGFSPEDPDSLATAIERLRRAARPDPTDIYSERSDPYDQRRRRDCTNLASALEDIQRRQGLAAVDSGGAPC